MRFDFGVFAENDQLVSINIDVDDSDGAEEIMDMEESADQVEALLRKGVEISTAVDSFTMALNHFKKFKVTREGLHLLNADGKLGAAIGMSLPRYESDGIDEDISDSEIESVDVTVVVENISERLKSAKDAVVEFFKRLYERIKDFFIKYFGVANRLSKKLEKINSEVIKNIHKASESWNDLKISAYKESDFAKLLKDFGVVVKNVKDSGPDASKLNQHIIKHGVSNDELVGGIGLWTAGTADLLKQIGYEIEVDADKVGPDDDQYIKRTYKINRVTPDVEKTSDKLSSLGWSTTDLRKHFEAVKTLVNDCKKQDAVVRKFEKFSRDIGRYVEKQAKDRPDDSKKLYRGLGAYKTATTHHVSVMIIVFREALKLATFYVGLCNRATIKER
jgi:hypothetical protein